MDLKTYRTFFYNELNPMYPLTEIRTFFGLLLEEFMGLSRIDVALTPEKEINEKSLVQFNTALNRLKQYEPIQYILGKTEFYGLELSVNDAVLIPRPETEELVQWILEDYPAPAKGISILDIGTGSGCIPIALAKNRPDAKVSAVDVSEAALNLAKSNARQNGVEVDFQRLDILNPTPMDRKFEVIVSNPPYVRRLEKEHMTKNVLDYEPHLALFVADEDALVFYQRILDFAQTHLRENGRLYFEVNEFLREELTVLFKENGWADIHFRTDGFGKLRMARVEK